MEFSSLISSIDAASHIGMAELSSHDVVNQTRSGGEPSPSDVPASNNDKNTAEGDVGRITNNELTVRGNSSSTVRQHSVDTRSVSSMDTNEVEKLPNAVAEVSLGKTVRIYTQVLRDI